VIRPGDTPCGTRHMRMEAAPIQLRAEEAAGSTASRQNEPPRIQLVRLVAPKHDKARCEDRFAARRNLEIDLRIKSRPHRSVSTIDLAPFGSPLLELTLKSVWLNPVRDFDPQ